MEPMPKWMQQMLGRKLVSKQSDDLEEMSLMDLLRVVLPPPKVEVLTNKYNKMPDNPSNSWAALQSNMAQYEAAPKFKEWLGKLLEGNSVFDEYKAKFDYDYNRGRRTGKRDLGISISRKAYKDYINSLPSRSGRTDQWMYPPPE